MTHSMYDNSYFLVCQGLPKFYELFGSFTNVGTYLILKVCTYIEGTLNEVFVVVDVPMYVHTTMVVCDTTHSFKILRK
jgi:hypothetical protein